jgi:hypothetical protein
LLNDHLFLDLSALAHPDANPELETVIETRRGQGISSIELKSRFEGRDHKLWSLRLRATAGVEKSSVEILRAEAEEKHIGWVFAQLSPKVHFPDEQRVGIVT